MREGLVCPIPPAAQQVCVHVVLYLPAEGALWTGVDDKLTRVALVKLRVKDVSQ